ncbi:class I SAM-dependent methyltransferase [Streptomyces flavofungini]|uniref:class I SAM-dependent methyltransferase n=1 Tax=Streptomyces flavofungini TaxID=68200 RepID=UPI0025AFA973|nr:class I SAM-dependent methyltransferase [Streptomyces flavofungini]WJV51660.1 class I SAM-dependent methyltransferase [Streptomyces flavofungini]
MITDQHDNIRHLQDAYDAVHTARAATRLVDSLYAQAMGDAYPVEVAPTSSCDWPLLGTLTGTLRMGPGKVLADLGCGTGGVGLWLARALAVRLIGIDISPAAVRLATARAPAFVPQGQAEFRTGTLTATGLPDRHVDTVICIDALSRTGERPTALRELHRILRPGGRAVITRSVHRETRGPLTVQEEAAGFAVERVDVRPAEPHMWGRLYGLWLSHENELRDEVGDRETERMLAEARRQLPRLPGRSALVLTLRRPADEQPTRAGTLPTIVGHEKEPE